MTLPELPHENACLFLDVDGTLIDLAATPDAVVVPPRLVPDLVQAKAKLDGALGLVSGRSIADLDRLFSPLTLDAGGVHGAEFRLATRPEQRWSKASPLPERAWADLSAVLSAFPACLVENKAYSYAVHYRAAPAYAAELRTALERFLAERPDLGLQIMPGHYVYELKRPDINKGEAIRTLMEEAPFAGRVPIFIGDDVTDAPGFTAVAALGGYGYSVGRAFPDTAGMFPDPAAVRHWVARIGGREAETA